VRSRELGEDRKRVKGEGRECESLILDIRTFRVIITIIANAENNTNSIQLIYNKKL
jgi:hypothetical protein